MEQIKALEQKFDSLDEKIDEQGRVLSLIHVAVAGDELLGIKGIKHHVKDLGDRVAVLEKDKEKGKKIRWLGIGAAGGAGVVGGAFGSSAVKSVFAPIVKLLAFIGGILVLIILFI